jgi:hypothetical protein
MWSAAQSKLLKDFCELNGIAGLLNQIAESGSLLVDDVAFTLMPSVQDASSLRVFAQFGEPPAEQAAQVYRRLLEINLLMPQERYERLGIDPSTGTVIFTYQLANPSAESLHASLRQAASHARAWQVSYFLDEETDALTDELAATLEVNL